MTAGIPARGGPAAPDAQIQVRDIVHDVAGAALAAGAVCDGLVICEFKRLCIRLVNG